MAERLLTVLDLPYALHDALGDILTESGFSIGSQGDGTASWERDGEITDEETKALTTKMLKAIENVFLQFDVAELDESEDG